MDKSDLIAEAIANTLTSPNELDSNWEATNVVDGLFAIAKGLHHVGRAIERLGTADANTPMGAMEAFIVEYRSYMGGLISSLDGLAEAVAHRDEA